MSNFDPIFPSSRVTGLQFLHHDEEREREREATCGKEERVGVVVLSAATEVAWRRCRCELSPAAKQVGLRLAGGVATVRH